MEKIPATATETHPATTSQDRHPVALVTGGSRGLGLALVSALADRGWRVVTDGRDGATLVRALAGKPAVTAVPGDVADPEHRRLVADAVHRAGGPDLIVNNASILGPSPQPALLDYPLDVLAQVYAVNTLAPLGLLQLLGAALVERGGRVVNVSSDAAVEAYAGWGGYGSAKSALDHLTAVLALELPGLRVYAFDPGDMATDLQQQAFPGTDITDRPTPDSVLPALLRLVTDDLPSGRYRAVDLAAVTA